MTNDFIDPEAVVSACLHGSTPRPLPRSTPLGDVPERLGVDHEAVHVEHDGLAPPPRVGHPVLSERQPWRDKRAQKCQKMTLSIFLNLHYRKCYCTVLYNCGPFQQIQIRKPTSVH